MFRFRSVSRSFVKFNAGLHGDNVNLFRESAIFALVHRDVAVLGFSKRVEKPEKSLYINVTAMTQLFIIQRGKGFKEATLGVAAGTC